MSSASLLAYLVLGDDPYLVSEAVSEALSGVDQLSIDRFSPEDDPVRIFQALESPSMFGGRRAVVLRGVDEARAELQRRIAAYLEAPNPDCLLILTSTRPVPSIAALVRKAGRVMEAGRGRRSDLFTWLKRKAGDGDLRLQGEAMVALVEALGEERMALASALDELALALGRGARVGAEEVRRQFHGRAEMKIFALLDAVSSRESGPALEALHRLLAQGESPHALLSALARHFRLMLLVAEGPPGRAARTLGLSPWRAEKILAQSRGFSIPELAGAYRMLARADHRIKTGSEPEALTLE
ncbi:MAG: DNA polymerase III subunit delta, partial [Candidatus Methylomirabilales bacterium]